MTPDEIAEEHKKTMNALAEVLNNVLNPHMAGNKDAKPKVGFTLLVFNYDDYSGGRVNYISNAQRESMVEAMNEFLSRADPKRKH